MKTSFKSVFFLLLTAVIWGLSFVAQRTGVEYIGPFWFTALRSLLGASSLAAVFLLTERMRKKEEDEREDRKDLLKGGLVCGVIVFAAMNLQQIGLQTVEAGKASFLMALYIILVPVTGIFFRHRTGLFVWAGAFISLIGIYLLSFARDVAINGGDIIILIGAFVAALHILAITRYAPRVNVVKFTALQFLVAGILSLMVALPLEDISWHAVSGAAAAIIYTGVFSTGVAFTCQAMGQKDADPTVAAMLLSTEAVWAAVFGFIILGETLCARELAGCAFMLAAIFISQIPSRRPAS